MDSILPVVVIGAGPAGLAISALLVTKNVSHMVIDKEPIAGGLYANLHAELPLLSPPLFSSLPLLKYQPADNKNTVGNYHQYLNTYIKVNSPPLRLNEAIIKVTNEEGVYYITTAKGELIKCQKVVIATGMSSFPKIFKFKPPEGIEVQYAKQWKGIEYYREKNILVVGSGTSAFEISSLLAGQTNVWLATNDPVKVVPVTLAGINIHYFLRPLELLPISLLSNLCKGRSRERALNQSIKKYIHQGLITLLNTNLSFENDKLLYDGSKQKIDIIVNCTGYQYDTQILPDDLDRYDNGNIKTHNCQSISHSGLFFIGHPCSGGIDSNYLRGIYRDAYRLIKQLG